MKVRKLYEVINSVINKAKSNQFKNDSRMSNKDFTRSRKLSFFDYVALIMQCNNCSIQSSINMFLHSQKEYKSEYSKQAFSKGRHRIKPEAFRELMVTAADTFYADNNFDTFGDYLLLSVDGSDYNLPNSQELLRAFGSENFKYATQVQAQTSTLYDVLNGIVLEAEIAPFNTSERELALLHIENFRKRTDAKAIILMDRGYPSFDLMLKMEELNINYLMRCNKMNFLKEIRNTASDDEVVKITRNGKTVSTRVITIKIDDTDVTFITNLTDRIIGASKISELYHKRWKIETLYNKLKNRLEIENFSGLDELCVKQDFYASMLLSNIAASAIYDSQNSLNKHHDKKSKKQYFINQTFALSELKMQLIELVYTDSDTKRLVLSKHIQNSLKKNIVLYQPGRSFERKVKHPSIKHPINMKKSIL